MTQEKTCELLDLYGDTVMRTAYTYLKNKPGLLFCGACEDLFACFSANAVFAGNRTGRHCFDSNLLGYAADRQIGIFQKITRPTHSAGYYIIIDGLVKACAEFFI